MTHYDWHSSLALSLIVVVSLKGLVYDLDISTYNIKGYLMEYELYFYCTGMGTLIILLILLYHCLGQNEKHEADNTEVASTKQV